MERSKNICRTGKQKKLYSVHKTYKMRTNKDEEVAKRICHYYENAADRDEKKVRQHLMAEGINRTTTYRVLRRFKERGSAWFKRSPGRIPKIGNKKVLTAVKRQFTLDPNISVRNAACKLGLAKSTLQDIKLKKLGIKAYSAIRAPKYTANQEKRAKTNCRRLSDSRIPSRSRNVLVIDDETYCATNPKNIPGKKYYHCSDKDKVSPEHKFQGKTKFPNKYLVWQAMDEMGNVSDSFITTGSINQEIYLKECIKKRLIPFIKKYHKLEDVVFWPDLASAHYARKVTDYMTSKGIDFIEKENNAPNVPQARPIEKYLAHCKARYRKRKTGAKNLNSFKRIWSGISRNVARDSGKALMANVRKKIRSIGRNGVYGPLTNIK